MAGEIEIEGLQELMDNIEKRLGRENMLNISQDFAKKTGKVGKEIVKVVEESYSDTGQTIKETTYRVNPAPIGGYASVDIGWKGPKKRVSLVHLNELGYNVRRNGMVWRHVPRGYKKLEGAKHTVATTAMEIAKTVVKKGVGL